MPPFITAESILSPVAANGKRTRHVLIVDDDATVRRVVRLALEGAGLQVTEAVDGLEALSFIFSSFDADPRCPPIDVLISDLWMPVLDGQALIAALTRKGIVIPTMVLSGANDHGTLVALLRLGCRDYVTKPFNPPDLINRVQTLLRTAESSSTLRYRRKVQPDSGVRPAISLDTQDPAGPTGMFGVEIPLSGVEVAGFRLIEAIHHIGGNRDIAAARALLAALESIPRDAPAQEPSGLYRRTLVVGLNLLFHRRSSAIAVAFDAIAMVTGDLIGLDPALRRTDETSEAQPAPPAEAPSVQLSQRLWDTCLLFRRTRGTDDALIELWDTALVEIIGREMIVEDPLLNALLGATPPAEAEPLPPLQIRIDNLAGAVVRPLAEVQSLEEQVAWLPTPGSILGLVRGRPMRCLAQPTGARFAARVGTPQLPELIPGTAVRLELAP